MNGMAVTHDGRRMGPCHFRGKTKALIRTTRKFRGVGIPTDHVWKAPVQHRHPAELGPWTVRVKSDSDRELLEELRKSLNWMKALERPKTDRIPRQVSAEEGAKEPRRIPSKRREAAILRRRAVAVLALALVIAMAAGWALFQKGAVVKSPFDFSQPRWKDESATHFTFAAAGDFGGPDNNDSVDYPRDRPLARFILLSAGLKGVNYNYGKNSPHTEWVEDAVANARDAGIPWVIAGVHKECITVANDGHCPMGQYLFDELLEAHVDLILVGHDHVYERSKQLRVSSSCESVNSTNRFDPSCVAANGTRGAYAKGKGT